jgi:hypothetical protein
MKYAQFVEQDDYCLKHNNPTGPGCDSCPASHKDRGKACADSLRNDCGRLIDALGTPFFCVIADEIQNRYGLTPYNILAIARGRGEIEFPE